MPECSLARRSGAPGVGGLPILYIDGSNISVARCLGVAAVSVVRDLDNVSYVEAFLLIVCSHIARYNISLHAVIVQVPHSEARAISTPLAGLDDNSSTFVDHGPEPLIRTPEVCRNHCELPPFHYGCLAVRIREGDHFLDQPILFVSFGRLLRDEKLWCSFVEFGKQLPFSKEINFVLSLRVRHLRF